MRSLNYRKQIWMSFQLPLKHLNRNWTPGFRKVVPKSWSCNQRALSQYVFRIDFRSSNSSCEPELSLWFLNISAGKSAEKQQQQQPRPKGFLYCFKRKKVQTTLEIRVLKKADSTDKEVLLILYPRRSTVLPRCKALRRFHMWRIKS